MGPLLSKAPLGAGHWNRPIALDVTSPAPARTLVTEADKDMSRRPPDSYFLICDTFKNNLLNDIITSGDDMLKHRKRKKFIVKSQQEKDTIPRRINKSSHAIKKE